MGCRIFKRFLEVIKWMSDAVNSMNLPCCTHWEKYLSKKSYKFCNTKGNMHDKVICKSTTLI